MLPNLSVKVISTSCITKGGLDGSDGMDGGDVTLGSDGSNVNNGIDGMD